MVLADRVPGRRAWRWVVGLLAVWVLAHWPVTTKQGVNFEVSTHRLPLYVKAFEFLDRDAQFAALSAEVLRGATDDEQRVSAAFAYVRRRVQPTPDGWPIVDDHVLNIAIRGYGQPDQQADVYTLLLSYGGVRAFWAKARMPGDGVGVVLSYALVGGRWTVADVANGFLFRNRAGQLATAADVAADRLARPDGVATLMIRDTPYADLLDQVRQPPVPTPLRTDLQKPWPRLWHEFQRAVRLEHEDGSER